MSNRRHPRRRSPSRYTGALSWNHLYEAKLDNGANRYRASQNLGFVALSWRLR